MSKFDGPGFFYNDVTKDINKIAYAKNKFITDANDAWRKAKEEDPTLEFRMSFLEFKKKLMKKKISRRKHRINSHQGGGTKSTGG